MKKNIFKKVVVLFGLSFVLLGFNIVTASDTDIVAPVADTIVPVISLVGNQNISINVGDVYTDAGATVTDNVDTNLVVSSLGTVDTSVANIYTITYSAVDSSGNQATPVTRTVTVNAVVPPASVSLKETFIIRGDGGSLIWEGQIDLPSSGKTTIDGKEIDSRSVLAVLSLIDPQKEKFSISAPYSDSFGSFYLKCITPKDGTPLCDNWQYAVGQVTPWTAIDKTPLVGGETVGIYFGSSHHLVINKNTITTSDSLSVTSEKYNYESNLWVPLTGVNIGVTLPNPNDQWNPIVVNQYPVDTNGVASFTIKDANTYTLGIVEDYYFPSYQVVVSTAPVSGGGVAPIVVEPKVFSLQNAISYLSSSQKSNGSFGDDLYTDWVAIGISQSSSDARSKISNYLKNNEISSSVVTDNERHSMALMALGIDPYSGTNTDYIKKITDSFDGSQIGNSSLLNDDIFGLIVLKNAGYNSSDNLIVKDVNYLVSKQSSNGSFGGIDLTAAAVQALNNFKDIGSVNDSISKALNYLAKSQESDGGFGNSFATSWVLQALSTNSSLYNSEISKADNYLTTKQQDDGGVDVISSGVDNRVWATSYSIPAILHLSWNNILNSFSKPSINSNTNIIPVEEKKVEAPIVLDLPKAIAKTEEIKNPENKIIKVISKKTKNTKIKPIIKSTKNNTEIKSSVNVANSEPLPVIKKNIFIQAGSSIILGIKALFGWLF